MKSALVFFAHGARDAQWSEPFKAIREAVARRRPGTTEITVLSPIGEVTELLNAIADRLVDGAPRRRK